MRLALVAPVIVLATPLLAQQRELGTLGLNLRVGGSPAVGVTWRASPAVVVRPAVSFAWNKTETPLSTSETTQYTVNLDLLLRTASWNRLTSYIGAGGGVGNISGSGGLVGKTWAARALAGAQLTVVDRVAVFGELGFEYDHAEGFQGKQAALRTFPIGIVVFLK